MLGLVLADNLLVLYTCWELTSVTSYLLIGNDHTEPHARAAALQALLVTGVGGLAMLAGFVAPRPGGRARTDSASSSPTPPPRATAVTVGLVLVLVGAFDQVGAVPVPLLAARRDGRADAGQRLPALGDDGEGRRVPRRPVRAGVRARRARGGRSCSRVGLVTMIAGGLRALRQHDLKLLLAYGTVSQLGFLFVLFGAGHAGGDAAGCVLLLAHALFKAALFMVVGHRRPPDRHPRHPTDRPPLAAGWRPVAVVAVVGGGVDGRAPADARVRGQGGGVRRAPHGQLGGRRLVLGRASSSARC